MQLVLVAAPHQVQTELAANGLNAGLPKMDVNLVIADDPIFDVGGIDISFDYQRDESQGAFFTRGNSLVIDGCSNLSVRYRIDNGVGSFATISSGNVYAIPNDNTFRTYRFIYIPTSGTGSLLVNGTVVWSNDGPDGRDLYWTGAGDIIIGSLMDGSGSNRTFLDNLTIGEVNNSALPITMTYFEAKETNNKRVDLSWETTSEINNEFFTIEKCVDGGNTWSEVISTAGAGNSNTTIYYNETDWNPRLGVSFYRLKQTDFNGESNYSKIQSVNIESVNEDNFTVFPNPSSGILNIVSNKKSLSDIIVYNSIGQILTEVVSNNDSHSNRLTIDISNHPKGVYYIQSNTFTKKIIKN